ncbi:hypothetical protein K439DRAFT_1622397 [Ramaria rubella]|nr:hypothetical protein K439DRAFT_1622397 [Ramaria rubella]
MIGQYWSARMYRTLCLRVAGHSLPPHLCSAHSHPTGLQVTALVHFKVIFAFSWPLHALTQLIFIDLASCQVLPILFLVGFWTDKFAFFAFFSLNFTNEECARECEQRQMTPTTNHRERAAAATAARMLHQPHPPPPPHPFPHLALQQPQRHSGDPFIQPPIAGPSHIPSLQPPIPSPRDQVANICAQLAAIQQQQPPPARRRQQRAVQSASGVNNNVPLGPARVADIHAQLAAIQQQQPPPAR